jgi:MYXO-CTERM domain-containing protein
MVACALDGHEIASLIIDDNICRILPNVAYLIGGAKVVVDERDQEQALDVIHLVFPGEPPYGGSFITVGIAGAGFFAVLLALPWLLRRRRDTRALEEDDLSLN